MASQSRYRRCGTSRRQLGTGLVDDVAVVDRHDDLLVGRARRRARPWRRVRRGTPAASALASSEPWLTAAMSDSTNSPSCGPHLGDSREGLEDGVVGHRRVLGDAGAELDRPVEAALRRRPGTARCRDRGLTRRRAPGRSASCRPSGGRRSTAAAAPTHRHRRRSRDCPREGRRTPTARRRGRGSPAASSRPPPITAPRSTDTTGIVPNWMSLNGWCQPRLWSTPSNTEVSVSSDRSSPALKWSPDDATTATATPVGRVAEERTERLDGRHVERVALGGTVERDDGDRADGHRRRGTRSGAPDPPCSTR